MDWLSRQQVDTFTVWLGLAAGVGAYELFRQARVYWRGSSREITVQRLLVYPIKSCGGIEVISANVDTMGLAGDRRFLMVDPKTKNMLTIRQYPRMALLQCRIRQDTGALVLTAEGRNDLLLADSLPGIILHPRAVGYSGTAKLEGELPASGTGEAITCKVWDSVFTAETVSPAHDAWLTEALGRPVQLLRTLAPGHHYRAPPPDVAAVTADVSTGFADGYPLLLASTASMYDLNLRMSCNMDILRFRPNIIVTGNRPWEEDTWDRLRVGSVPFWVAKPCARCTVPTVDPQTGTRHPEQEPSKTMGTFRSLNGQLYFGQNLVQLATAGRVQVGDLVAVESKAFNGVSWLSN